MDAPEVAPSLSPEIRCKIEEIRRAADELQSVTFGWEKWILTVGQQIEACPDYGHDAYTPPAVIAGMAQALILEKQAELALRTLYGHRCVPPSLRALLLEDSLSLFPSSPKGAIKSKRDKDFVVAARQAMPSLRELSSDLANFLDHLDFARNPSSTRLFTGHRQMRPKEAPPSAKSRSRQHRQRPNAPCSLNVNLRNQWKGMGGPTRISSGSISKRIRRAGSTKPHDKPD